jgi:molybdate transport repressor ModE-like protein
MIDMQRLRVLREVAQHGSFSRAAAALLLTPSAVSQQIAALERSVGTAVVERTTRGTVLTEPGRMLVDTADLILAELSSAQEQIGRMTGARTDRLTVATFASAGQKLLPRALRQLTQACPAIELTVLEHDPEQSIPLVQQGRADIALAYHFDGPPPVRPGDRSGLRWTPLLEDPMSIVVPAGHPLAGRASVALAELGDERWVHGCAGIGETLAVYAALADVEIRVACNTTDYAFAQALIAAGVGIGLVPQVAHTGSPDLSVIPLQAPHPTRYIGLVTASRRPNPLVDELIEILGDQGGGDQKAPSGISMSELSVRSSTPRRADSSGSTVVAKNRATASFPA